MLNEFSELQLRPELVQTLANLGYSTPTPIQAALIPLMLSGQDVIGQAPTGTGKTAAFSLPILHHLVPKQKHIQALVLAPTRELALQVSEAMYQYGQHNKVRVLAIYGGQSYSRQIRGLKRGVDVVAGTPGRLLDLLEQGLLDLSHVSTVVLDEADEMLSMGFIEDIETILKQIPSTRQTALLSATLPPAIRRLANRYMNNPQACTIKGENLTVDTVEQRYYLVNGSDKLAALTRLFEVEPITSALIFARTRLGTGELANELTVRGFPAEALNGDMSQEAREKVLQRFRLNQIKVLVATDVAARGLDIDDISHVFNYDIPLDPEVYVHRIGRTGRAGKTGVAISILSPQDRRFLYRIQDYTRLKLTKATLPTITEIQQHRKEQLLEQVGVWLRRGRCRQEKLIVEELVTQGFEPLEIAAVALKLARAEEKQRPIAPISEVQDLRNGTTTRKRNGNGRSTRQRNGNGRRNGVSRREKGMVRLSLSTGRVDGVQVNHVVGTLAHYADIPGHAIGKISIQQQQTLVDVPEQFVRQVLAKTGKYRIGRQFVTIERAS